MNTTIENYDQLKADLRRTRRELETISRKLRQFVFLLRLRKAAEDVFIVILGVACLLVFQVGLVTVIEILVEIF